MRKKAAPLALMLTLALLLSSCERMRVLLGVKDLPAVSAPPISSNQTDAPPTADAVLPPEVVQQTGDGRFSLRYHPARALNPITGMNSDNMIIASIMYEGLFRLNADFTVTNVLCESFETTDGKTFIFHIRENIAMSDGSTLDAHDVVFSLTQARSSEKYLGRLRYVSEITDTDRLTVRVTLSKTNYSFPRLLDIPIIKYGYTGATPPGTGPFRYVEQDGERLLIKMRDYRDGVADGVDAVYLVECGDKEQWEMFTDLKIDLLSFDPNGSFDVTLRRDHETRYYDTTVLQYIGFNPRGAAISDVRFRQAVSLSANRGDITERILSHRARSAYSAISPAYDLYDEAWSAPSAEDPRAEISRIFMEIGLVDSDEDDDTWLEYPTDGTLTSFVLSFIVSDENPTRVEAAKSIADTLRHMGIDVKFEPLPFSQFKSRLEAGSFDLYYGEARLSADFDLSPLLNQNGALNYGHIGGGESDGAISDMLGAQSDFSRKNAARALCALVTDGVPFAPVCYKQYAVYTGRGAIRDMTLSPSGVFCDLSGWKFSLGELLDNA
ncbi:MAG: ABC transporter substrate-binding protein [Oscillospiraceae bacterium]|nr:ABC transporter substrate-binding protein [Oscillospiraceae bacterium]